MTTATPKYTHGTPLSIHDCPGCGAPISLRQEAAGESLLKLAAVIGDSLDLGLDGDCTPLYCVVCLERALEGYMYPSRKLE